MPRKAAPLTDVQIKNAKPQEKPWKLSDGGGLHVQITPTGGRLWRLKYRFEGKEKLLSFGAWPDVSLKQARQRRDEARAMVANGVDPGEKRKQVKAEAVAQAEEESNTFELVAREWHAAQVRTWNEGHAVKVLSTMEQHLFPVFGAEPISLLRAPAILPVLRAVEAKGINYTAKRLRQYCEAVFSYAIATGRAERNVGADLRGALAPCKVTNRPAIVEPKAVGKLLRAIDGYEGSPVTLAALKLAPLLFVRPGELRQPQGNGIAERLVRILKENLLWVRGFQTVEDLRQGLLAFKETYNTRWRVGRHGYRTPEQYREKLLSALGKAA